MCTYLTRCLRSGVINFLVGQIWISVSHYGSSWVSSRLLCVSIRVKWRVQGSWGEDIYQATTEVYRLKYLTFKSIQWSYILWSPACSFKKCQKIQKLKDRSSEEWVGKEKGSFWSLTYYFSLCLEMHFNSEYFSSEAIKGHVLFFKM